MEISKIFPFQKGIEIILIDVLTCVFLISFFNIGFSVIFSAFFFLLIFPDFQLHFPWISFKQLKMLMNENKKCLDPDGVSPAQAVQLDLEVPGHLC